MSTTFTFDAAAVAERIVETVPASNLAFTQLLGLLDVQLDPGVPTAGITLGTRPRLVLNPFFLEQHCRSDAALMTLVLHELNHVLYGHTRLFAHTDPASNVVFDALINAQLCRTLPGLQYTALFRDLYRSDVFPEALLRPPVGWGTPEVCWELRGLALEAHQALYSGDTVTQAELFELLATPEGSFGPERLLGTHGAAPTDQAADPGLLDVVGRIVTEWPARQDCTSRGEGGKPVRADVDPEAPRREAVAVVRRALVSVARVGAASSPVRRLTWRPEGAVLPFRTTTDRRAAVREAFGETPLIFHGAQPRPRIEPCDRTHVYVDVSFSMGKLVPLLYGALLPLTEYLNPRIHLFSTVLRDIDPARLRAGDVLTSGGTDIACVTAHMVSHNVQKAVIITDGNVGLVPPAHRNFLRQRNLRCAVVLTDARYPGLAAQLGGKNHVIPNLPAAGGAAPTRWRI
jgi:hypothetical protein